MELCHFCLDLFLNIEKVWDIEKFCNIAKFRKGKNDIVPTFFYVKFLDGHALCIMYVNHYCFP